MRHNQYYGQVPTLVTRDEYFHGALEILSTQGARGLQVVKLCKLIGVSTGSFYNYFRNWDDFVDQFLQHWRVAQTQLLIEAAELVDAPAERLRKMTALTMTVSHAAESAIRAWSKVNPTVNAVQREVDELRLGLIRRAVLNACPSDPDADRLATLGLSIVVGTQQLQSPVNLDDLEWALEQYVEMVLRRRGDATGPADRTHPQQR